MADLFEIYQDNITSVFYQIGRILDNINLKSSDKSESLINEAETHIKEAERIVT